MLVTVTLALVLMAALFLLLFSGVALIQDEKYFSSAPQEVRRALLPKRERFPGARALGWALAGLALFLMLGAVAAGAWQGIKNAFSFWQFFWRFLIMLWLLIAFDILFLDAYLLCRSGFFPRYYPEIKALLGPHLFGFNRKTHVRHALLAPALSLALAGVCTLVS